LAKTLQNIYPEAKRSLENRTSLYHKWYRSKELNTKEMEDSFTDSEILAPPMNL